MSARTHTHITNITFLKFIKIKKSQYYEKGQNKMWQFFAFLGFVDIYVCIFAIFELSNDYLYNVKKKCWNPIFFVIFSIL